MNCHICQKPMVQLKASKRYSMYGAFKCTGRTLELNDDPAVYPGKSKYRVYFKHRTRVIPRYLLGFDGHGYQEKKK